MRLATLAVLACLTLPAFAQQPPGLEPLPEAPPPPPIVEDDPGLEPEVTILTRGEDRVEEFRIRGQLYMVRVTPRHGTAYYLIDRRGDGKLERMDSLEPSTAVPLWVIKSW